MELARVLGHVVATVKVPSLRGSKILWIQPEDESGAPVGEPLAAIDTVRAGPGDRVFFVRAREAAMALDDHFNPVDAAIVGHVHHMNLDAAFE